MPYSRLTPFSTFVSHCCVAAVTALAACGDDGGSGNADGATTAATTTVAVTGSGSTDTGGSGASDEGSGSGTGADSTGAPDGVACVNAPFVNGASPGPNYEDFDVTLGSHCQGTDHQDITDIERVVFVGDSVTVGTPPTGSHQSYRAIMADQLAPMFDLEPPEMQWRQWSLATGMSLLKESGGFASCAEWGARNDDLLPQLEDCFEGDDFDKRTLVIFTMGGNDVSRFAQQASDGVPIADLFEQLEVMLEHHRTAMDWLTADKSKFPNGIFVVNANVYEFTDYTTEVLSCPASGLAGFDSNPPMAEVLLGSLNLINETYAEVAIETGTDIILMFEQMCGHGFLADDPDNVCYRGPDTDTLFDTSCIHPTPDGHAALAEMFMNVITE